VVAAAAKQQQQQRDQHHVAAAPWNHQRQLQDQQQQHTNSWAPKHLHTIEQRVNMPIASHWQAAVAQSPRNDHIQHSKSTDTAASLKPTRGTLARPATPPSTTLPTSADNCTLLYCSPSNTPQQANPHDHSLHLSNLLSLNKTFAKLGQLI
jgi:hypothetical protein